ncbi:MAG: hypothetical protein JJU27_10320 [Gammaproteobacteria bacterium]|nr:hypothetical protein [Gammaproteobacteria bacterium]
MLLSGLLVGLLGGLAAATLVEWVDHPRMRAHVSVQPNGGALEQFVIRLPRDRIFDSGAADGLPARFPADVELSAGLTGGAHIEQFKLRDREGEVIGVAARHSQTLGATTSAAWILYLPGRGSLLLHHVEPPGGLADELSRRGLRAGTAWNGEVTLRRTVGPAGQGRGQVAGGSFEFARHTGSYGETWRLTGVDVEGRLRGTIELDTLTVLVE